MSGLMTKILGASWRTSALGVLGIVVVVAGVGQALLEGRDVDFKDAIEKLVLSFALLKAKDSAVSNAASPVAARPVP